MAKTNPHGMTDQMFAFARAYIENGFMNGTGAYRSAYPKCIHKAAESSSSRLLSNGKVRAYLAEVQEKASEETQISANQVVQELAKIAFSNMGDFASWGPQGVVLEDSTSMEPDAAACVAEVSETVGANSASVRFKLHDKVGALHDLGRHLGMFTDRVEDTGRDGEPLITAGALKGIRQMIEETEANGEEL